MMQTIGQGVLLVLVLMLTAIIAAALYGFMQLMGDFIMDALRRARAVLHPRAEDNGTPPQGATPSHS